MCPDLFCINMSSTVSPEISIHMKSFTTIRTLFWVKIFIRTCCRNLLCVVLAGRYPPAAQADDGDDEDDDDAATDTRDDGDELAHAVAAHCAVPIRVRLENTQVTPVLLTAAQIHVYTGEGCFPLESFTFYQSCCHFEILFINGYSFITKFYWIFAIG